MEPRSRRFALWLLLALLPAMRGAAEEPAAAPTLRVFVVRHAQAWKNVPAALRPGRTSDEQLDALTPKGLTKATAIGKELVGLDVSAVYTSPAHRAEQTAEAIAEALGLAEPPLVDPAFAPLSAGTEKAALDWRWRTRNFDAGTDPRPAEGESLADGLARAVRAIDGIAAQHPGRTVVVVTHGEIAAALIGRAAGTPLVASYRKNFIDEGAVREIEVGASGWRLVPMPKEP
jgi:probable phosphoglycerate mutase